jgi:VanZ family protein
VIARLSHHSTTLKLLLLLSVAVVGWLTLTPKPVELPGAGSDKLAHFGAFFVLALLADLAWPAQRIGWRAIVLLVLYGGAIEIAQHYVPNRSMSAADLVADASGVLTHALLLSPLLQRLRQPTGA